MLELWRMRSIPSLPSLPGSLGPGVVASERVLSIGQIQLFDIELCSYAKLNYGK